MKESEIVRNKTYSMKDIGGRVTDGWKITYYPLRGTYVNQQYVEFTEPRALIEKPMKDGFDFREVPLRYLL